MRLYVDFDDCICETARALSEIAAGLFGKHIPYEEIRSFDLKTSFFLTDEEYSHLMEEAHRPDVLLSYEESPGASQTLNEWMDRGNEVFVITGRPSSTCEESGMWLDRHGLQRVSLFFLDKYGREEQIQNSARKLELEDYYRMKFDYAVEDSPRAFRFFAHLPELRVMVYDRPWNRECSLPGDNYTRCPDWQSIRKHLLP